jgi:CelD/BcsL family acetyltransferase involved in cellulose biosynthesis
VSATLLSLEGLRVEPLRVEPMRIEFHCDVTQVPFADKWEAFNRRLNDHDAPFFQSCAWNRHVTRVRVREASGKFQPLIATIWRGHDLIGIWPLSMTRTAGAWLVRSLDDPFGQFAGVAFRDAADVAPGVSAVVAALRTRADGLQIEGVPAGSRLHAALLRNGAAPVATQGAVAVDLRPHSSFDGFLRTVDAKTRKNLRNLRNRLQRVHQADHVVMEEPESVASLVESVFDARTQWMQRNGRTTGAFRARDFADVMRSLSHADGIALLGFALKTERDWISMQWGFVYDDSYYAYMSAMNPAYHEFSPGRLHLKAVIESCFQRGIKTLELMPPAADYKLEWSDRVKNVETMSLPFSAKGQLVLGTAAWMVPRLRRLSRALPETLRRSLVRRLNYP